MGYEWDRRKSDKTLLYRGFDFDFASVIFNGKVLEEEALQTDYGERRFKAIGMAGTINLTVIYTLRGDDKRIISAWRSSKRERKKYEKIINEK